ncbi:MAG: hypothetical protein LBU89_06415 [Fibromonadaceae bacterium]|nr:hypothetical protein [Fibromonadaceae bacterium]
MKNLGIAIKQGLLAALCVGVCGCSIFPETEFCKSSRSYPYWTEWTDGELITIANDSLAVVVTRKYKKECREGKEETANSNAGLFLVNYRVKQKPLMGDTLNLENKSYDLKILMGYFKDSSVLLVDSKNNRFALWKIGEKTVKFNDCDEIELLKGINASPWVDKSVIINNYPTVQILDTETGQIKFFGSYKEYEWMSQERVQSCLGDAGWGSWERLYPYYIEEEDRVICVKMNRNRPSELIVDGVVSDTRNDYFSIYKWLGSYIMSYDNISILKIDTENFKFDETLDLWMDYDREPAKFYKDKEKNDFVSYSGQDLINFKLGNK